MIPQALVDKEIGHRGITELRVVESMHERKALMAELSDAFIALPGGLGTLEELFEVRTWAQLGLHASRAGCSTSAATTAARRFLDHAVEERFLRAEHRAMLIVDADPRRLLERLQALRARGGGAQVDRPERDADSCRILARAGREMGQLKPR